MEQKSGLEFANEYALKENKILIYAVDEDPYGIDGYDNFYFYEYKNIKDMCLKISEIIKKEQGYRGMCEDVEFDCHLTNDDFSFYIDFMRAKICVTNIPNNINVSKNEDKIMNYITENL